MAFAAESPPAQGPVALNAIPVKGEGGGGGGAFTGIPLDQFLCASPFEKKTEHILITVLTFLTTPQPVQGEKNGSVGHRLVIWSTPLDQQHGERSSLLLPTKL